MFLNQIVNPSGGDILLDMSNRTVSPPWLQRRQSID